MKYLFKISALILSFGVILNAQVTDTIRVKANWNMVSLPLKVQDTHYSTLFPGAISPPFTYDPPYEDNTLENGISYFIKFALDTTYLITGELIHSIIINLPYAGWHMVGSISYPVLVNNIQIDPAETIRSDFFEYNPTCGYEKSDTIKPGSGSWIKVDRSCKLILTSMGYPCPGVPTVEYGDKLYYTVQIGNQCWLRKNLNIGTIILGSDAAADNGITEKYCYDDDSINCEIFGGLYSWDEAMDYSYVPGSQGVCPDSFHIPTYEEFQALRSTVNFNGDPLKASGTNTSGFSALLAGYRSINGDFLDLSSTAAFWSALEYNPTDAYIVDLGFNHDGIYLRDIYKTYGFSVRCLKD